MNCENCKTKEEYREVIKSLEHRKAMDEKAMLNDIARKLWAEYGDFMDSVDDKMDIMLGEIYREKLKSVFKILEQSGIELGKYMP